MTIENAIWSFAIPYAIIVATTALLTRVVGLAWVLALFESEGKPSARIMLACIVVVFSLFMVAADRISDNKLEALLIFSGTLLGLGTSKIIASRFAARPPAPAASIKANKAEVNAETANVSTESTQAGNGKI